jgi:hypothetical protein
MLTHTPSTPLIAGRSVKTFGAQTNLGRTKIYELISAKQIEFAKIGRRTIILTDPAEFVSRFKVDPTDCRKDLAELSKITNTKK